MKLCLVFRHIPFCEGKVNNYPKQYSYYFCKHLSSPPFVLFLLLSLGLSMQSAPNCDKDNSEFDDDHESCHGLSPPFFYNYLRLFFAFVADGFDEVWAGILPPGERFDLLVQAMSNPVCWPRGCIKTIYSMVTIEKTRRWVILD